jgi:DNA-binding transcriptional LysR family regulator
MSLSLDTIALLELIESRGSFSAAATVLNKAPSAITYQLRQLEESLDVLIYDRSGHKAKLTPAGRTLLEEGRRLLEISDHVEKRVKAVASGWEAELKIVLDPIIPFEVMMPWIQAFDELKSPTRLRVISEVLSGAWEALSSGRADLLIGSRLNHQAFATSAGLHVHNIGECEFVFAIAPKHPLATRPEPLKLEQITQHRAVAVGDTSRTFKPFTIGLQTGQDVLTVPTLQAKIQAQIAGLGCGWLPWHLAKPWVEAGQLLIKKTQEQSDRTNPICFAHQRSSAGKSLRWWTSHLAQIQLDFCKHT